MKFLRPPVSVLLSIFLLDLFLHSASAASCSTSSVHHSHRRTGLDPSNKEELLKGSIHGRSLLILGSSSPRGGNMNMNGQHLCPAGTGTTDVTFTNLPNILRTCPKTLSQSFRGGAMNKRRRWARLSRSLQMRTRGMKNFALWNGLAYAIIHRSMVLIGPIDFIEWSNGIVFSLWCISSVSKRISNFMHQYFLTPRKWSVLRTGTNPLSAFGGAFSHIDPGHMIANYSVFTIIAPDTLKMLGASKFSHLYLVCSLMSSLASCLWDKYAPRSMKSKATHGLGASGAISGIMAYWCCESAAAKGRRHQWSSLIICGNEVTPSIALLSHILTDMAGLFRSKTFLNAAEYITLEDEVTVAGLLHSLFLREEKSDREISEGIGYDAHLGGSLGGLLFYSFFNGLRRAEQIRMSRRRKRRRFGWWW